MRGLSASARAGHRRVQSPNRPGRPRTRKTPNGGGQKKRGRPTKEQLLIAAADRAASASRFRSLLVGASTNERTTTASPSTGRSSDTSSAKPMRAIRRSLERNRQVSSRPAMANANQLSRSTTTPDASPTSSDRGTSEQILFLSSIVSSTRLGPGATLEYQGSSVPNDIRVNSAKFTGLLSACGTSATDVELFVVRCGGACFFESAALAANISTSSLKTRILNTLRSSDKMEQLFEALRPVGNGSVFISENGNVWTGDTFSDFFVRNVRKLQRTFRRICRRIHRESGLQMGSLGAAVLLCWEFLQSRCPPASYNGMQSPTTFSLFTPVAKSKMEHASLGTMVHPWF
eukprot:INCI4971.5.p2 GENE.INCI4971.5~~INCI4971.5.p2  ORF type:complete len:346 (+),score=48.37 INCI4971.5:92-1129(+)